MIELHEIEELFKNETLIKSRATVKNLLMYTNILKHPNSTEEQKNAAREAIKAIGENRPIPKPKAAKSPASKTDKLKNIADATKEGEKVMTGVHNKNIDASLKRISEKPKEVEAPKKTLPGSQYTKEELEAQAARAARDPKEWKQKEVPTISEMAEEDPHKALKAMRSKLSGTIDKHFAMVKELTDNNQHDTAHKLMSAFPKEFLPDHMKDYNPMYVHYNVTPEMWKHLPKEHKQYMHGYHNDMMSGKHDANPDQQVQGILKRVRAATPKVKT